MQPTRFTPAVFRRLPKSRRGSVILLVLISVFLASYAMTKFVQKAGLELLTEAKESDAARLRLQAYSALEVTLGVLEDFRLANNGLRSPAEGWADPLGFAGYELPEGMSAEIQFDDESGKLSLPLADQQTLEALFQSFGVKQMDSQRLADSLLVWTKKDYEPTGAFSLRATDYDRGGLPCLPPGRPLRSFSELASIDFVREQLYDEHGRPNELWRLFVENVSLFSFQTVSINGARSQVLGVVGKYDERQQRAITDYLNGTGFLNKRRGFFKSAGDIGTVIGAQSVGGGLDAEIKALRIHLTLRQGRSAYRLSVVVAPQGGAKLATAPLPIPATLDAKQGLNQPRKATSVTVEETTRKPMNYPFAILEIRENDAISAALPPAPSELKP